MTGAPGRHWTATDDERLVQLHLTLDTRGVKTRANWHYLLGQACGRTAGAVAERLRVLGVKPRDGWSDRDRSVPDPLASAKPRPPARMAGCQTPAIRCTNCGDVATWDALPETDAVALAEAVARFCARHSRCPQPAAVPARSGPDAGGVERVSQAQTATGGDNGKSKDR